MIVYSIENSNDIFEISEKENERYPNLSKGFLKCGDYEQFVSNIFLENTNNEIKNSNFSVFETFEYIFNKFKKGLFLQIRDNEVKSFVPFSKINYQNNWSHLIKIDPSFGEDKNDIFRFKKMLEYINKGTKYEYYDINFHKYFESWYSNNGLFRFEYPLQEWDSGYPMIYDMFQCLVSEREVSNIDVFVNKRDFPIINRDRTEPYYNIFGREKLIETKYQENFENFLPILSMNAGSENLDVKIPTWEDWRFFEYVRNGKLFHEKKNEEAKRFPKPYDFHLNFDTKIPVAIFRGSSTGIGVTSKTNQRLFVCELSSKKCNKDKDGFPFLDAKLTSFNRRPRKVYNDPFVRTIDINNYRKLIGEEMSYVDQSRYKYVLHIPGHSCAYRLTLELFFGSVVLYFPSETSLWYFHMLKPHVHYIPVAAFDKESLFKTIQWCKENDEKCKEIAKNARDFAIKYLNSEYALDYLKKTFDELSEKYPICYNNKKIETEKRLIMYNEIHMKSLDSILSSLVHNYWVESFYFLQILFRHLDKSHNLESFLDLYSTQKNIIQSKNTVIDLYHYQGLTFIKKKIEKNYRRDDLQQLFIGYHCINKLCHRFPQNFVNTIYHTENDKETHIFLEYKKGSTMFQLLQQKALKIEEIILIWIELCCILQVAQNFCSFIHNDLMTWNIIIQKLDEPTSVYFEEFNIGIKRQYIPIIIDYGDSHMVYQNKSYYNTIPFHPSKLTDVNFLVFKSLENFINSINTEIFVKTTNDDMKQKKFQNLLRKQILIDKIKTILTFFPTLVPKSISRKFFIQEYTSSKNLMVNEDIWKIKNFLKQNSKYSTLLEKVECLPKNKNPIEFVYFLIEKKLVEKKMYFQKVQSSTKLYLQPYNTPYFHFYLRNELLLNLLKSCENCIIMNNDIPKFQKKVEDQLKTYLKLLIEVSSDITKSKHKIVLLFKKFYDNQFEALVQQMKTNFNHDIYLNDIHQFNFPNFVESNPSSREQKKIFPLPIVSFLESNYNHTIEFEDENEINFDLIKNMNSLKHFDFFERRLAKQKN